MASFMVLLILGVILSGIFSFKNNFKVEERHDLNAVIQAIVSGENSPPPLNDDSANSSTSDLAVVALVDLTDFQPNGSPLVRIFARRWVYLTSHIGFIQRDFRLECHHKHRY